MKEELLELVLMFNGNFCVIPGIKSSETESLSKKIDDYIIKSAEEPLPKLMNVYGKYFYGKHLVGWYFRMPVANLQSEAMELLKLQTKAIKTLTEDESDDWKTDGDKE